MKRIKWASRGRLPVVTVLLGAVLFQPTHSLASAPIETAQALPRKDYTGHLIVKLRDTKAARLSVLSATHVHSLSAAAGVSLTHHRAMSGDAQVMTLPYRMSLAEATTIAQRLSADPAVEYAEPDRILRPLLVPNDAQYANQWHYHSNVAQPPYAAVAGGANLPGAWDITTGSAGVVVAVIDTGLVPHADIDSNILDGTGRVVPGYDFVSEDAPGVYFLANDGNGRDADPTDPGDWATAAEVADPNTPCVVVSNSSWHGTHVAGTIGALSNNTTGAAGINWTSRILPVRAIGKCGGYLSDIVDGARWAAGLSVVGVPANANPAKVLNLSLGGPGACSNTEQNALNEITAAGAVVVVAAGNENTDAASSSPGNCNGVITVAAVNRNGARAPYSNFGTTVEIAAPGGAQTFANDSNGVLSTLNTGLTVPVASPGGDAYVYYQGTSMAAPHVAGIVSLMVSLNPALTPAQVLSTLQSTARTFPTGTGGVDCTITTCGTGIVNAAAAAVSAVTVNATDNAASETGPGTGTFTITRTGSTTSALTVNFTMSGTAASNTDYTSVGTSVVIAAASATATVTITPIDDALGEGNETAILTLAAGTGYSVGSPASATVTIADNEPTVSVVATDAAAAEAALNPGTFTVTRSVTSASSLTVTYTMSGTAARGTDYTAPTGSVIILANNAAATVTITPIDDSVYEGNETVVLTVSAGAGYSVGSPASASVTIAENDPAPPSSDGGGGGGGGCSLNRYAQFDPLLPLLLLLSGIVLWRRRVKI